jgi:hypothetical protein
MLYTEYLGYEIIRKRGRQIKGIKTYLQFRASPKCCLRGINTRKLRRNPFGSLKRFEKASEALMSQMENAEMQVAALKPCNSLIVAEKYNVLWVLNIARQGGLAQTRNSSMRTFPWLLLPVVAVSLYLIPV